MPRADALVGAAGQDEYVLPLADLDDAVGAGRGQVMGAARQRDKIHSPALNAAATAPNPRTAHPVDTQVRQVTSQDPRQSRNT